MVRPGPDSPIAQEPQPQAQAIQMDYHLMNGETSTNDYMEYLRYQLEEVLPPHDKRQDEFLAKIPNLIFIPTDADELALKVYDELCAKQRELLTLQRERDELTNVVRKFYNLDRSITLQQCREKLDKLFHGKQEFFVRAKELEELLYKLHGRGRI
ncbi:hypothetical protein B5X24_HaOG208288 [Helicoverpa armigera]|nr:hypothetical protein B5X24_HaOG208288 [Helicoverpa armigera]